MAVVYQHRRKDTNEVFYIGIGKSGKRAHSKIGRNKYWRNIVNKVGYEVDVLIEGLTWKDACEVEKGMIADYGRNDLGLGSLVNMTDGGDGSTGAIRTQEFKDNVRLYQLSLKKKGKPGRKQSQETIEKIRYTLSGTKRPQEVIEKIKGPRGPRKFKLIQEVVTCPHCSKVGGLNSMKQHHFDNCKVLKPVQNVTCPHCGVEGYKNAMGRHHFNNCKSKK